MKFIDDLWQLKKAFGKVGVSFIPLSVNETVTFCFAFESRSRLFRELAFIAEHYGIYLVLGIGLICLCVYVHFSRDDDNEL